MKLIALTLEQWEARVQTTAAYFARKHGRPESLWPYYTPEAEHLMSKTWTKGSPDWAFPKPPGGVPIRRETSTANRLSELPRKEQS